MVRPWGMGLKVGGAFRPGVGLKVGEAVGVTAGSPVCIVGEI